MSTSALAAKATRRHLPRLIVVLGALAAVAPLSIDAYVPALPRLAVELRQPASEMQLTLAVFVVGLAVGQLLAGALADGLGRRPVLLAGLAVFVIASLVCASATSFPVLLGGRVAQAFGVATAAVLSRAVVRDVYEGRALGRAFATLMMINAVAPVVAPVLGGALLAVASWRAVFLLLAVVGALLLASVATLVGETLPAGLRTRTRFGPLMVTYGRFLSDPGFLRYVLPAALMFAAVFVYISLSAFVLQDGYGLSPQAYSVVFAANGAGILTVGRIGARAVSRGVSSRRLLVLGLAAASAAGTLLLIATAAGLGLWPVLVALFFVVAPLGLVLANATTLALADHRSSAGTAAALQGVLQFAIAAGAAALAGRVIDPSIGMAAAIPICAGGALIVHLVMDAVHRRRPLASSS